MIPRKIDDKDIIILALGDVSYSRDIGKYINNCKKNDYTYPLKNMKKYLINSHITLANLESIITDKGDELINKSTIRFRSDEKSLEGLIDSGINLLNLANNHIYDYGKLGIEDTIYNLLNSKIDIIGVKPYFYKIYEINLLKIGFIGVTRNFKKLYNNNLINILDNNFFELIKQVRSKVDILILTIHWGTEYNFENNEKQRELAIKFIENGVNIIIGHHPHVIQNMEKIIVGNNFGYVFYSIGNFLFDSHVKKKGVRNTFILKIIIKQNKSINFRYLPCIIHPEKGFIPVNTENDYVIEFPKKTTKKAEDLYKYVYNTKKMICENFNIKNFNYHNKIIFMIFIILINYIFFRK